MSLILALILSSPPPPAKPPQGWLDCGFTPKNVYVCKP